MNKDDELLKDWCKKEELDFKLAKKLKAKIFPLLEEAHKKLGYKFDKAYGEQRKGTEIRHDNTIVVFGLLQKLNPKALSKTEKWAITLHLEYLTLVEGVFSTQINFLIFILVANGHDLYSTRKGDYVKTLKDIEEVNLGFKLKFLKEHGFANLISNKVDTKLRNSIAHLFYEVDEKDNLKVGNRLVSHNQYSNAYTNLRHVSHSLHLINLLYYKRFESVSLPKSLKFIKIKCSCGYENIVPNMKPPPDVEPLTCTKCGKIIRTKK